MLRRILLVLAVSVVSGDAAHAFRILDAGPALGLSEPFYVRWDAAPRTVFGEERSLDGGLRYSLEGGSYEAFRDQLTWAALPTVAEFQTAVERAFAFWTATDPVTGLGTSLTFVADFATEVYDDPGEPGNPGSWTGVNLGAEIDIIAETPYIPGAIASALAFVQLGSANDVTLTSGTTQYAGFAISGADIRIDPDVPWILETFETVLAHEIGHTIGFADFWLYPGVGGAFSAFLDDNYDGANSATALATLTNSFALTIDPFDPDSTPLIRIHDSLSGDPGLATPGVHMLMEELSVARLSNNEVAGRQFLYPVPEPVLGSLLGLALGALAGSLSRRGR